MLHLQTQSSFHMHEFIIQHNRYAGLIQPQDIDASQITEEDGLFCLYVPLGDDPDFVIYFYEAGDSVTEKTLEKACLVLSSLPEIDNQVQAQCALDCRQSQLHPMHFYGSPSHISLYSDHALIHYFGTKVNTEWEERITFDGGICTLQTAKNPASAQE